MTERKLTSEEVDELFDFCRKHYVNQYDLQIELVDHMAASIEAQWEKEPDRTFRQVLNQTYREFGITGFSKIKSAKEKALRKKYNQLFWQFIRGYFKIPKILFTIAFTLSFFMLLQLVENDGIIIGIYIFLFLPFGIAYHFYIFPKYLKIKLIVGKSFLLNDYLTIVQQSLFFLIWFPLQLPSLYQIFEKRSGDFWLELLASSVTAIFTILIYANCFFIPKKIKEHFTQQFPQFISS